MITERSKKAERYLNAAARTVSIYGEKDSIGMLLAELVGAALYLEGDVMEVAERIVAAQNKAREEGF